MQQELVTPTVDLAALEPHVALRVRLAAAGLKQYTLAQRLGMAESVLSRILTGRKTADADTLARIGAAIDELAAV